MILEDDVFNPAPLPKLRVLNQLPSNPEGKGGRFPSWLHRSLPKGKSLSKTNHILEKYGLNTVCEEAKCPNRLHCFSHKTATFLALGKACTRNCGFCDIDFTKTPLALEADEPERIALSVAELGLKHVVITMVARDDLPDGGGEQMGQIIQAVRLKNQECTIEVLTTDFEGRVESLDLVLNRHPEVFNHNIETVRRISPRIRHKATYDTTLKMLQYAHASKKVSFVKSGLMVGLGETESEVFETLQDLKNAGCQIVTIGQYLQADKRKLLVKEFITPQQFKRYEEYGYLIGIPQMYAGPFVRSSFNAHEIKLLAGEKMALIEP
ncbi:lipoyl synthase [Rhabdochlamydiaceae symbiont of Dictyostelium giganteum]|uniref:lipoyl synthase n=1 Tax=Rhabdochlamydiaceae symbiont of Dictyostelium giganteum TaxID=3342349 RepID=UPI00384FD23B